MKTENEVPKFQGIADPKCKCTPEKLCRRCAPPSPAEIADRIDYVPPRRFLGKFREPWNAAVKKNNEEAKGGKP